MNGNNLHPLYGRVVTTYLYMYADEAGALLYVGITGNEVDRYRQHTSAEWWPYAAIHETHEFPNRAEAEAVERMLIGRFQPPFNRKHNPDHARLADEYRRSLAADFVAVDTIMDPAFLARAQQRREEQEASYQRGLEARRAEREWVAQYVRQSAARGAEAVQ